MMKNIFYQCVFVGPLPKPKCSSNARVWIILSGAYPQPDESIPIHLYSFLKDIFNDVLPSTPVSSEHSISFRTNYGTLYTFPSLSRMPHVPPI